MTALGYIFIATTLSLFLAIYFLLRDNLMIKAKNIAAKAAQDLVKDENQMLKLQMLNAQIKPHFIFNCLNSINNYIIKSDAMEASAYLTQFSKFMRMVLENSDEQRITLSKELEYIELYLKMEQLRLRYKFNYRINVDQTVITDDVLVPPMILQPFVENSIWHGLHSKSTQGSIVINISALSDQTIQYSIEDDGSGRKDQNQGMKHKSYGMGTTLQRLRVLYGPDAINAVRVIDLKNDNGASAGTKVTITFPMETKSSLIYSTSSDGAAQSTPQLDATVSKIPHCLNTRFSDRLSLLLINSD